MLVIIIIINFLFHNYLICSFNIQPIFIFVSHYSKIYFFLQLSSHNNNHNKISPVFFRREQILIKSVQFFEKQENLDIILYIYTQVYKNGWSSIPHLNNTGVNKKLLRMFCPKLYDLQFILLVMRTRIQIRYIYMYCLWTQLFNMRFITLYFMQEWIWS